MYHRQRKNKQRIRTKFSAFMMLFVFIIVFICHIGLLNPDLTASVKTSFQDTLKGLFTNSSKQDTALFYSESRPENTTLSVTFLDVGQGDSILIQIACSSLFLKYIRCTLFEMEAVTSPFTVRNDSSFTEIQF